MLKLVIMKEYTIIFGATSLIAENIAKGSLSLQRPRLNINSKK